MPPPGEPLGSALEGRPERCGGESAAASGGVSRQSEGLLVEVQQGRFAGRPRVEAGGPLLRRLARQLAQGSRRHLDADLSQAPGQAGRGARRM